jgi:hypothetical protein
MNTGPHGSGAGGSEKKKGQGNGRGKGNHSSRSEFGECRALAAIPRGFLAVAPEFFKFYFAFAS